MIAQVVQNKGEIVAPQAEHVRRLGVLHSRIVRFIDSGNGAPVFSGFLALHRRLGFVADGRRRRARFAGGRYEDETLFGMTTEEFTERYGR